MELIPRYENKGKKFRHKPAWSLRIFCSIQKITLFLY